MSKYVFSSPWQDAANFGGAVGDRLTKALIELPLQKQRYAQELLQNAVAMRQGQARGQMTAQHYDAEEKHWQDQDKLKGKAEEVKAEGDFSKHLGSIISNAQKTKNQEDLLNERVQHDKSMEGALAASIAARSRTQSLEAFEKTPHPELDGMSIGQVTAILRNPTAIDEKDAARYKAVLTQLATEFQKGVQKENGGKQETRGVGDALNIPARKIPQQQQQSPSGVMVNPQTGQKIKFINGQWTPIP